MSPERYIVRLGDERVGVLEKRNGGSRFVPDPAWAAQPAGERRVLGQRFEERPWSEVRTGQGLPDWFEHLLPEEGGPLRRAVARGLHIRETSSFAILDLVGADLPGAVAVTREDAGENVPAGGRRVVEEEKTDETALARLRFSLAGLQLKFSARSTERGLAVGYGGDRIVKLADQRFDHVPANEFTIMGWAARSGLSVPRTSLIEASTLVDLPADLKLRDPMAFVIERYDRLSDGTRVHQEDFAQVLGLSPREGKKDKYEGTHLGAIARLVVGLAPQDCDEFIRRVTFMVLSANNDMHAKNWSFFYPDGVTPRLAPSYDLVCTEAYLETGVMALSMSGTERLENVTAATLERFCEKVGMDPGRARSIASETVDRALSAWPEVRDDAPEPIAAFLDGWLATIPLVRALRT